MSQIDYYFTVLSPWAYLAGDRLEQIAARHGAMIRYKPIDIGQVFARTGGTPGGGARGASNGWLIHLS